MRLAADGPAGSDSETGLGGLHSAMAEGRLDGYRAAVVAGELSEAPPEVAATVVTALDHHFETEDAAHLRRRCRRALARISPDLLVQRAQRTRAESGLQRWAEEPGVDRWVGTFPSEEAAQAWAAIDALAQRYVAESVCATIERARAKALTDLVAGNATIETVVTVTVPVTALPDDQRPAAEDLWLHQREGRETESGRGASGDDLIEVGGLRAGDPVLVPRAWVSSAVSGSGSAVTVAPCHPVTGALTASASAAASGGSAYRPSPSLAAEVRARDRRCRFPGCTVAAVFCDLDHVHPWPAGPTIPANLMCLCRRHHRVKQRPGWRVVLAADGVATWTDPTGRVRSTEAVDALRTTVLPAAALTPPLDHGGSRARTVLPDGPHSPLEFLLEHCGAGYNEPAGRLVDVAPPRHGIRLEEPRLSPDHRPTRSPRRRHAETDPPPF